MPSRRSLLATVGTATAIGTAGCLTQLRNMNDGSPPVSGPCDNAANPWPTAGGDPGRTGQTHTDPPAQDAEVVDPLRGARKDGHQRYAAALPVVADGTAYVPSGRSIVALNIDAPTEDPLWIHDTEDEVEAVPALACGALLVPGLNELEALDPTTGDRYWQADVGAQDAHAIGVIDETVYATGWGPESISVRTGDTQWSADGGESLAANTEGVYTTLSVNGTGGVFGHDRNGEELWHLSLGKIVGSPSVLDGTVYIADNDGTVYAIDAATGETHWSRSLDGVSKIHSGLAVRGDDLVVPAGTGERSVVLDATSGKTRWVAHTGIVTGRPVISEDWIAFGRTNVGVTVYDRSTGKERQTWSREAYDLGTVNGLVPIEGGFIIREGTNSGLSLIQ